MTVLLHLLLPQIILAAAACALFMLGVSSRASVRRVTAWGALLALLVVGIIQLLRGTPPPQQDPFGSVRVDALSHYIKLLAAGVGVLLVLLAWPTRRDATGNAAMDLGHDAGEFYSLLLASIAGLMLVADANDLILLFLGLELASVPTYVMVSVSRPLAVAQEAGVKYFFLGAMSAALMLFGFSYLYGTTGHIRFDLIAEQLSATIGEGGIAALSVWQMLAVLMLIAGFAFKMAVVPLHFYAPDVYQGAATPVTAFLSFVPKAAGLVAMIRLLGMVGGEQWLIPHRLADLLWALAVLTMTVGNVLGLLQFNVKRVLAYSSIAHSGYMLVGLTALAYASDMQVKLDALQGVLFYLAAYGIMNAAAFGVLILLPARDDAPATSAETFEDLAGQGRRHVALGLAMAVACFSLTGLPLTVGFFGKLLLIKPALDGELYGLAIITVINAAISAAYYLRIVGTMFLRSEDVRGGQARPPNGAMPLAVVTSVVLSVAGTLLLGTILPATQALATRAAQAISAIAVR